MRINLTAANEQTGRARAQARNLREIRTALLTYQSNLQRHWNATEMTQINHAINVVLTKIASTASNLDLIASDIIREAEAIRREEELAEARAALRAAEAERNRAQQSFQQAQTLYNANPSPLLEAAMTQARGRLTSATNAQNSAAARVQALS